jgi:hypothetical protein
MPDTRLDEQATADIRVREEDESRRRKMSEDISGNAGCAGMNALNNISSGAIFRGLRVENCTWRLI